MQRADVEKLLSQEATVDTLVPVLVRLTLRILSGLYGVMTILLLILGTLLYGLSISLLR